MPAEREKMIAVLRERVVPALRQRGFQGAFPHFRRSAGNAIDLLTFQFDKWGGGFVVEIASCPAEGVTLAHGERIAPDKVTAQSVSRRLRLGARAENADHWFRFDRLLSFGNQYQRAANAVLPLLDAQAEPWWRQARA